ncbi:hypothetical protein ACE193_16705 [Bernardetia sp. OM2101]|uniref:hypothetical protein n=1 Tax=Bernardetia sp. OM2101 TaxID=3344876 RepID=UPI0035D0B2B0
MKYLKNPYLPTTILLLLLTFFGYKTFFDERYTQTEKEIFGYNYHQNIGLKQEYEYLASNALGSAKKSIDETYGTKENNDVKKIHARFKKQRDELQKIYQETHNTYFEEPRFELVKEKVKSNPKYTEERTVVEFPNLKVVTAFNEYVQKVSALDSSLSKRYQDFVFEEGMSNEELDDFYFDTDDYLRAFHYSRFEAQLATMYYEDAKLLSRKYFLFPLALKAEDIKVVPYVHYQKGKDKPYYVTTMSVVPFDKENTRLVYPENVETKFDENGFIIVPKEFRKGMQKFQVQIPTLLQSDTSFVIVQDFNYLNTYYKDEK